MKTIKCLRDLEEYGIVALTGEACAIYLRVLCDFTKQGQKILARAFGIPDFTGAEPWNNGSKDNPHVGSIMLDPDDYAFLGIFALLEAGYPEVYVLEPRMSYIQSVRICKRAVLKLKDEVATWRPAAERAACYQKLEDLLEEAKDVGNHAIFSSGTVYGLLKSQCTPEHREEWFKLWRADGFTFRCFQYRSVDGVSMKDRNVHQMSGRVT